MPVTSRYIGNEFSRCVVLQSTRDTRHKSCLIAGSNAFVNHSVPSIDRSVYKSLARVRETETISALPPLDVKHVSTDVCKWDYVEVKRLASNFLSNADSLSRCEMSPLRRMFFFELACSSGDCFEQVPGGAFNLNRTLCFRNLDRKRERALVKFGFSRRVQFGNWPIFSH